MNPTKEERFNPSILIKLLAVIIIFINAIILSLGFLNKKLSLEVYLIGTTMIIVILYLLYNYEKRKQEEYK